jgi:hypothetical protein
LIFEGEKKAKDSAFFTEWIMGGVEQLLPTRPTTFPGKTTLSPLCF